MTRKYIVYDERAMSGDTDDAMVLDTADDMDEAKEAASSFAPCVIYSYRLNEKKKHNGVPVYDDEQFEEYITE